MKKLFLLIVSIVMLCSSCSNEWEYVGEIRPVRFYYYETHDLWRELDAGPYELWTKVIDEAVFYQLRYKYDEEQIYLVTKNPDYSISGEPSEKYKYEFLETPNPGTSGLSWNGKAYFNL